MSLPLLALHAALALMAPVPYTASAVIAPATRTTTTTMVFADESLWSSLPKPRKVVSSFVQRFNPRRLQVFAGLLRSQEEYTPTTRVTLRRRNLAEADWEDHLLPTVRPKRAARDLDENGWERLLP